MVIFLLFYKHNVKNAKFLRLYGRFLLFSKFDKRSRFIAQTVRLKRKHLKTIGVRRQRSFLTLLFSFLLRIDFEVFLFAKNDISLPQQISPYSV